ncbi:type VII secretion target [Streptomyces sp. NPDC056468]|uniref:type VII secretion target n=1 Tax=unclassified Streptomyces TaxID=2593676 RepID=UPI00369491A6
MSGGFDVEGDALRKYAKAVEAAAGRVDSIRSRTQQLELTQETFGKLPQSDELKADYDTQRKESGNDLTDAVDTLYAIADALKDSAEAYDGTEMQNRGMMGGGN